MSRNQSKGLISTILSHLKRKKLKKEQIKQEIVGTDFHGNRYILKHADKELNIKESRFVLPSEENAMMYKEKLGMGVPPEWNAWLRFSRVNPPTEEELERNRIKKLQIQQRVKELAEKERMENQIEGDTKSTEITETISGDTTKVPYPTYDDLHLTPGQMPKPPKD